MRFGFKQPLVGEKRCVTTLITAGEETSNKGAETKNEKRKVPFSLETTVLQSRQSTASLHFAFFFRKLKCTV